MQPFGGGATGFVAAAVVARCCCRGGVAEELLDGGEVGAGVEEVAGMAAAQVVRREGFDPAARLRRPRTCRMASPLRLRPCWMLSARSMGQNSGPHRCDVVMLPE